MSHILIQNIGRLLTLEEGPHREGRLGVIRDAVVLLKKDKIEWVGTRREWEKKRSEHVGGTLNAKGGVVLPGFIDCHTHLVHAGTREKEFLLRSQGVSYAEIAKQGGGILSTVTATRKMGFDELYQISKQRADLALKKGFTTLEIKSGYGLDVDSELKILEVIQKLQKEHPLRIVPTFLGAHTFPQEFKQKHKEYVDLMIDEMLPKVAKKKLATFIDCFVEDCAFSEEEAKQILKAGEKLGFKIRLHVDQLQDGKGSQFAAAMKAVSADHLDYISDEGVEALRRSKTIAVLLPGASFFLGGKKYPPARKLLNAGVPVALSTDYNPGTSPTLDPFLIGLIAATQMNMSIEEIILGWTKIPAKVLGLEGEIGSLAEGKSADLILLKAENEVIPFYHFGTSFVDQVIVGGKIQ